MDSIRIRIADNGYMVEYDDPKIVASNRKENSKYKDPEVTKVYADEASMMLDLSNVLPNLKSPDADDQYNMAFKAAAADE